MATQDGCSTVTFLEEHSNGKVTRIEQVVVKITAFSPDHLVLSDPRDLENQMSFTVLAPNRLRVVTKHRLRAEAVCGIHSREVYATVEEEQIVNIGTSPEREPPSEHFLLLQAEALNLNNVSVPACELPVIESGARAKKSGGAPADSAPGKTPDSKLQAD